MQSTSRKLQWAGRKAFATSPAITLFSRLATHIDPVRKGLVLYLKASIVRGIERMAIPDQGELIFQRHRIKFGS